MIKIKAKNETEAIEMLWNSGGDVAVLLEEFLGKLNCVPNAAQAKAVVREAAERTRKRNQIEEWRDAKDLYTVESFPEAFTEAVKRVYGIDLKSYIERKAITTAGAFVEYLGTVYFSVGGYDMVKTNLMAERTWDEWLSVEKYL